MLMPILSPIMRAILGARVGGAFDPLSLFATGEVGVYYDPSDMSTLFQDFAGTTPVTAAGQPVGLMLDKSQGLVLGPELVTNGTFDTATGWTLPIATISGGKLNIATATADITAASTIVVTAGRTYEVEFDIVDFTSGSVHVVFGIGANANGPGQTGLGHKKHVLVAGAGNSEVRINTPSGGFTGAIDNLTVKLLAGNHASQPTAGKRPILQESGGLYSLKFDGVDDFMSTAAIDFSGTDKVSVWVGVTKLDDAARLVAELSANVGSDPGSFYLLSGADAGYSQAYTSISRGTANVAGGQYAGYAGVPAPDTAALTITHDISGDLSTIKRNGVAGTYGTVDKGAGNFGNYPLYIASRAGTSAFFRGNLYPLVIAGALYDANTVAKMNTWTAKKTGVTL